MKFKEFLLLTATVLILGLSGCTSADEVRSTISTPDFARIPDGMYEGTAFIFPVNVKVKVEVGGGRITGIELIRHFNGQGSAAEAIVDSICAAQSLNVDVVSSATHSSITILKAVENALRSGGGEQR